MIEILGHVNKRVKHQLEIGLPLSELWQMYQEPDGAPIVKNFCIVYIEMAFERLHTQVCVLSTLFQSFILPKLKV